jgi:hypothetical protein
MSPLSARRSSRGTSTGLNHCPGPEETRRRPGCQCGVGMKSRPLDARPRYGRDGCGTISAGSCLRGSDPLGERIGGGGSGTSSSGWVAFRSPAGSLRLERMYYGRVSPSSLFRTNFLNCHFGVAGASEAYRSYSQVDIAYIVPSHAENRLVSSRTPFSSRREISHGEAQVDVLIRPLIVPNRHRSIRALVTTILPPAEARSAADAPGDRESRHDTCDVQPPTG